MDYDSELEKLENCIYFEYTFDAVMQRWCCYLHWLIDKKTYGKILDLIGDQVETLPNPPAGVLTTEPPKSNS